MKFIKILAGLASVFFIVNTFLIMLDVYEPSSKSIAIWASTALSLSFMLEAVRK